MDDQAKVLKAGVVAGAALGAGVALVMGLRVVFWGAAFGLGMGLAMGVAEGARRRRDQLDAATQETPPPLATGQTAASEAYAAAG